MSIDISVSNTNLKRSNNDFNIKTNQCSHIIQALIRSNIEAKIVPNLSIIDSKIEEGCTITLPKDYCSKEKIKNIWNIIQKSPEIFNNNNNKSNDSKLDNYNCANLKIEGQFSGCIFNYLNANFCPTPENIS